MTAPNIDEAVERAKAHLAKPLFIESDRWRTPETTAMAESILTLHASRDAEAKVVEWSTRWRTETCSRMPDCVPYDGSHDHYCEIMRNEREGVELIDDLIRLRAGKEKP